MQKVRYNRGLGKNIRRLRKEKHFTQEAVVSKMQLMGCTLSRETYAKIESGIANIKVDELISLCQIFDTDFNSIFEGLSISHLSS